MTTPPDTAPHRRWVALVLAAGAGKRFGGGKLRARFDGRPLIAHALEAAWAAPVEGVTLVVGADREIEALGRGIAGERPLTIVQAPDWAAGLSASLRAGIAALPPEADGVFVFLGDMPRPPRDAPLRLARAVAEGARAAAPVFGGRRGHPVLIGRDLFPALLRLSGDQGAGAVLADLGDGLARLPTEDPGAVLDLDTPEALAALELG